MSVINKMLRDLDQRHAGVESARASEPVPGKPMIQGTVPLAVHPSVAQKPRFNLWWMLALTVLVVLGALGFWRYQSTGPAATSVTQAVAPPLSAVTEDQPVVLPQKRGQAEVAVLQTPGNLTLAESLQEPKKHSPVVTPAASQAVAKTGRSPGSEGPVAQPSDRFSAGASLGDLQTLRLEPALKRIPTPPTANSQQSVVARSINDTLAQSQSLWSSGAHGAATELLQQALSQVESASTGALPVSGQAPLARLARELARLNLVEGQVSQALALLTRLEPQLAQIADLWAMRANAAQRLGQHTEAVKSYKQALLLKPDEPRWLSGQAVSLAALGQTTAAGELAEMAHALGGLRPEVATYLRQLGVPVRMD